MTHTATPLQRRIGDHMKRFCETIAGKRAGSKLILVHNGDAIDGDHHSSGDVCTTNELEQSEIHIELMENIKKMMDWQRGDELHYTRGTHVHVKHWEDYIADKLMASISERLEIDINGRLFVWSHHGAAAGVGANEGNALRNKIKSLQRKTSFAWQVATLAPSIIGGTYIKVTADGLISPPVFVYDEEIY
jgi:Ni/Co efflux regulator RcnB